MHEARRAATLTTGPGAAGGDPGALRWETRSLVRAGQAAAWAGRRAPAYRCFVQACELDPLNPEAWLWRAGTALASEEAIACLERTLALDPGNLRARLGLAELRGRHTEVARLTVGGVPGDRPAGRRFLYVPLAALVGVALVRLVIAAQPDDAAPTATVARPLTLAATESTARPTLALLETRAGALDLPTASANVENVAPPDAAVADNEVSSTTDARGGLRPDAADGGGAPQSFGTAAAASAPAMSVAVPAGAGPATREVPTAPGSVAADHNGSVAIASPEPSSARSLVENAGRKVADRPVEAARAAGPAEPRPAPAANALDAQAADGRPSSDTQRETGESQTTSAALASQVLDAKPAAKKPANKTRGERAPQAASAGPVAAATRPPRPPSDQPWVAVHRATALWSGQDAAAVRFRPVAVGELFQVARPQDGPRLYVWDPGAENYAYIDASAVGPAAAPREEPSPQPEPERGGQEEAAPPAPPANRPWVAVHRETGLWSGPDAKARLFRLARRGEHLQVARPQDGPRLYVWDPRARNYAYVDAVDVGPVEGPPAPPRQIPEPAAPQRVPFWSGTARVTMYTCVELGGCNRTAMGIWPYEGVVAVDPRVIPLGSEVWLEGLGTFLAADTGSAIYGNRIDVFVHDYQRAIQWGVRYLNAAAYARR